MLEAKLWYKKTETKNAKVAKMAEFIKTFDQYPRWFNFLLLMCLEVLGEGFFCFPGRDREGICRKLLSLVKL